MLLTFISLDLTQLKLLRPNGSKWELHNWFTGITRGLKLINHESQPFRRMGKVLVKVWQSLEANLQVSASSRGRNKAGSRLKFEGISAIFAD